MAERAVWTRRLAVARAIVFFVSTAFPVVAGLSRNPAGLPRAWGILDVVSAFVFASMAIAMTVLVGRFIPKAAEAAAYRAYRLLTHGILGMVVIFLLVGDRIAWAILLTGLAWRAWLVLYSLPAWFTAVGVHQVEGC